MQICAQYNFLHFFSLATVQNYVPFSPSAALFPKYKVEKEG